MDSQSSSVLAGFEPCGSLPGDVMWSLKDGKPIVSVPHHDGLLVDMVMMAWIRRLMEWLLTLTCG